MRARVATAWGVGALHVIHHTQDTGVSPLYPPHSVRVHTMSFRYPRPCLDFGTPPRWVMPRSPTPPPAHLPIANDARTALCPIA